MDHRLVCFVVTLSLAALAHAERPEGVCTPPAPARATLVRDTARLARAPRVRDVLRAGPLLDEIDALCEATRALFATCPSRLVAPLHAVTLACDRATAELEIVIEREDALYPKSCLGPLCGGFAIVFNHKIATGLNRLSGDSSGAIDRVFEEILNHRGEENHRG